MKPLLLFIGFYFCTIILCHAQADTGINMNDCKVLETVFNDASVKNYFLKRGAISGVTNVCSYFRQCDHIRLNGKDYKLVDSSQASHLNFMDLLEIWASKTGKNTMEMNLSMGEQGINIIVQKKRKRYNVTLNRIDNLD